MDPNHTYDMRDAYGPPPPCLSAANTPDGDVRYCELERGHLGAHAYAEIEEIVKNNMMLCRCADEVRCDMRKRIAELEKEAQETRDAIRDFWNALARMGKEGQSPES